MMLSIPTTEIVVRNIEGNKHELVDGFERVSAVRDYISGGFALDGLSVLTGLNGVYFAELPARIQCELKEFMTRTLVFESNTDIETVLAIAKAFNNVAAINL